MRLTGKADLTSLQLQQSVEPGEYSGLVENFVASYDATRSLQNSGSKTDMLNEAMEPLEAVAKEVLSLDDNQYSMWVGDMNYGQGRYVAPTRELSSTGEVIPLSISRLYDLASNDENVRTRFEELGIDMSSRQIAYESLIQSAADKSQAYQDQYEQTANKQAATGVLGDFAGSMTAYMTDPSDVASLFIGVTGKASLLRKIAEASAINVGVEALDYPNVTAWTERVTGSPYTGEQFLKDAGLITAGTAALVGVTSIPLRSWLSAVKAKANRAFTPKEELEAVELFREVAAEANGTPYVKDKTLQQIENKESIDEITDKENYMENDVSNSKHNNKVRSTLSAILRNDPDAIRPQTVQVDVDDIYALEKQNAKIDEFDVKELDPDTKVTGEAVDEINQGHILVFEDAAGNKTVMDGGKRVKGAAKAGQKKMYGVVLKETDGFTKETAEMAARIRNYYDGTIKEYDMNILSKYDDLVQALSLFDPLIKQTKNLLRLAPRSLIAVERNIITENIAALIGKHVDDATEQLAMIDKIKKANINDDEAVEALILQSIEDGSLKTYDISTVDQSIKSLFVEQERRQVIDGVLGALEKENITLKKSKKKADVTRRKQNEKAIQIIKEYGNKDSEVYGQITRSAQAIANGDSTDRAIGSAIDDIRTAVDEGRYDGLYHNGQLIESNVTAQINRVSDEFKKRNKDLIKYAEGVVSKQMNVDVANVEGIIKGRLELDDGLGARVIDFDAEGNGITLRQALDNLTVMDGDLDFINACRKT